MSPIHKILEKKQDELIRFAQSLVNINSCGGNETEVAKYIQKKMRQYGIKSRLSGDDPKRMNLEAEIRGRRKGRTLLLCGHMDTVPAGDVSKWKHPPFSGKLIGEKIYGRGTFDMKGGLASMVMAACALKEAGADFDGTIKLLFTFNEEAGMGGIRYAIKKGIRADACIVGEPRSKIGIGCRGVLWLELTTLGKTAHTANLKNDGINATTKMAKVLLGLEKLKLKHKPSRFFPDPKIVPGTIISGGNASNIYPSSCSAIVDCRIVKGQTRQSVLKDIGGMIAKLQKKDEQIKVKTRVTNFVPPAICDPDEKIVDALLKGHKSVHGDFPKVAVSSYATDGNFLQDMGIPSVTYGPEGGDMHSENEFVFVKSLIDCTRVYAESIINYLC